MPVKVSTLVGFDPVELERLRELSAASGAPVAAIIRRAVTAYLDRSDQFARALAEAEAREPGLFASFTPVEALAAAKLAGLR